MPRRLRLSDIDCVVCGRHPNRRIHGIPHSGVASWCETQPGNGAAAIWYCPAHVSIPRERGGEANERGGAHGWQWPKRKPAKASKGKGIRLKAKYRPRARVRDPLALFRELRNGDDTGETPATFAGEGRM